MPGAHDASNHASCLADCNMRAKIMPVNQHGACRMLTYARKLKNFNFFGACDAGRVNSQHLYTLAKVLRVFHQKTESLNFLLLAFIELRRLYSIQSKSAY